MGLLSKRKAKKEAKKAEAVANEKAAATASKAASAAKQPNVPGEIHVSSGMTGSTSGSNRRFRWRGRGGYAVKSHSPCADTISVLSKDTHFPATPAHSPTNQPIPAPLLPTSPGQDEEENLDELLGLEVVGAGRLIGEKQVVEEAVASATSKAASTKATTEELVSKKTTGNVWTRSKNFAKLTDWAFKTIDADGSGQVDKKELYTGLLMIHLKLATYAGPAACRPATREYCEKIFDQMDVDKSGELDREEFTEVMQIVCAQVFTRVLIQWSMTLIIVPLIAQGIIKVLCAMNDIAWGFWMELDELDPMRETITGTVDSIWNKVLSFTPGVVQTVLGTTFGKLEEVWEMIPDGVKETLPVTLMSCILSCILIPYMIYKMDEYHEKKAERKGKEMKKEKGLEVIKK